VQHLPAGTPDGTARQAEAVLVDHAATFDAAALTRLGAHIGHTLDADTLTDREEQAVTRRELHLIDHPDGTVALRGRLDTEAAAKLRTALDPLAAPHPTPAGTPDGTPDGSRDGSRDPRTPARRRADALIAPIDQTLDAGQLPATGGTRPHLTITATLDTLRHAAGAPAAETDWGGPLSAAALHRISCDAGITRILLDPAGAPLDVGREHRTVPPALRRALIARDRCCAFPGCDRPPAWCEAHHITHWAHGGPTSLTNLVLLRSHHHRAVHHRDWTIHLSARGLPEFIPPPWIDPDQTPRRNPYTRRPPDLLHAGPAPPHTGPPHTGPSQTQVA